MSRIEATCPPLSEQKKSMRSFYDRVASEYSKRDEGVRQLFHNSVEFGCLRECRIQGKKFLDIGSGAGRLPRYLGNQAGFVVGGDLSAEMLRTARQRIGAESRARFVQCDAEFLPFSAGSFDFVMCLGLFEYVNDLAPFLREFFRVTAPRGRLLFTCRNSGRLLPFRNQSYSTAEHTGDEVAHAVRRCGYQLVKHETIYHLDGKWIWMLRRIFGLVGGGAIFVRGMAALNGALRSSWPFRNCGKTHLVQAQRPN
jgi:ubiquinone/menaquinone biosynthesis C-methylase UbiE